MKVAAGKVLIWAMLSKQRARYALALGVVLVALGPFLYWRGIDGEKSHAIILGSVGGVLLLVSAVRLRSAL
jgi:hypothetical protein